jgi:hypothetical protein
VAVGSKPDVDVSPMGKIVVDAVSKVFEKELSVFIPELLLEAVACEADVGGVILLDPKGDCDGMVPVASDFEEVVIVTIIEEATSEVVEASESVVDD